MLMSGGDTSLAHMIVASTTANTKGDEQSISRGNKWLRSDLHIQVEED